MILCPACREPLPETAVHCGHCGVRLPPAAATATVPVAPSTPCEPWRRSIRGLMIGCGLLLVATFVAPWHLPPGGPPVFAWDALRGATGEALFVPLLVAAAGVLALVTGLIPAPTIARGIGAALAGTLTFVILVIVGNELDRLGWRRLLVPSGLLLAPAGLLLRSQYRASILGRFLATVGALLLLVLFLVPDLGVPPVVRIVKSLPEERGWGLVVTVNALVLIAAAALSLLVWLPRTTSAGGTLLAWVFLLAPPLFLIANASGNVHDPLEGLYPAVNVLALGVLSTYGLATVLGKTVEGAA